MVRWDSFFLFSVVCLRPILDPKRLISRRLESQSLFCSALVCQNHDFIDLEAHTQHARELLVLNVCCRTVFPSFSRTVSYTLQRVMKLSSLHSAPLSTFKSGFVWQLTLLNAKRAERRRPERQPTPRKRQRVLFQCCVVWHAAVTYFQKHSQLKPSHYSLHITD